MNRPNRLSLPDAGWRRTLPIAVAAIAFQSVTAQAQFSPCGRYRWRLERAWDPAQPRLLFIGLNPSRADAERDDPTLRRLVGFARAWGFGALEVVNLFARCSASPALLRRCSDPIGGDNDRWLRHRIGQLRWRMADALWLGWGNGGGWRQRDQQVLRLIAAELPSAVPLLVLGLTAGGQPRHPLYVTAAAQPLQLQHPGTVCRLASLS